MIPETYKYKTKMILPNIQIQDINDTPNIQIQEINDTPKHTNTRHK
jgi:hypothetical protein